MQETINDLVKFASNLADEARIIVREYYRADFDVDHKEDASPVTIADKKIETRLREIIEAERPDDSILGEEHGSKQGSNDLTWVIDPIDGTKSFVIGRPSFGTLIALCRNGVPIIGIIDQAILDERWIGAEGLPTTFNGKEVHTKPCASLSQARLSSTSPTHIEKEWTALRDSCDFMVWGGDCYIYGLLTLGGLDGVIEKDLAPHDFAAIPPIINGAGGHICDWNGNELTLESEGTAIAIGDANLKEPLIDLLSKS